MIQSKCVYFLNVLYKIKVINIINLQPNKIIDQRIFRSGDIAATVDK